MSEAITCPGCMSSIPSAAVANNDNFKCPSCGRKIATDSKKSGYQPQQVKNIEKSMLDEAVTEETKDPLNKSIGKSNNNRKPLPFQEPQCPESQFYY